MAISTLGKKAKKARKSVKKLAKKVVSNSVVGIAADVVTGKPHKAVNKVRKAVLKGPQRTFAEYAADAARAGADVIEVIGELPRTNHPEWYLNYPVDGLINFNFGRRKGSPENAIIGHSGAGLIELGTQSTAVAAPIYTCLTIPQTETNDWQQAIQYLASNIRSANAGAANWTVYDLEKYVLDVRAVHAAYAYMRRAYSSLLNFSYYDSTMPYSIFKAMGLDYDDWSENAANIRQYANKMAVKLNRLLPLKVDLLERTEWMYSNIFADSNDAKASYYVFNLPEVTYFGSSKTDTTVCKLSEPIVYTDDNAANTGGDFKWSDFAANVTKMVNSITANDTYMLLAGDILKAYGEDALYFNSIWGENEPTPMVYDEAALTQIQNAVLTSFNTRTVTGATDDFVSQIFTTSGFSLPFQSGSTANEPALLNNVLVNSNKDNVNPGEALSMTRLIHTVDGSASEWKLQYCGTEVCLGMQYIYRSVYGQLFVSNEYNKFANNVFTFPGYNTTRYTRQLNYTMTGWGNIDYGPRIIALYNIYPSGASTPVAQPIGTLWDFNTYAVTTPVNIAMVHGYAAMSLVATERLLRQSNAKLITTM